MSAPEFIRAGGRLIAIYIPASFRPSESAFLTGNEANLQCGLMKYAADAVVEAHIHLPVERRIAGTQEIVMVREGRSLASLYDEERRLVCTRILAAGDILILLQGGHGFRMLEDTVLVDVKQGPYPGAAEKERFAQPI